MFDIRRNSSLPNSSFGFRSKFTLYPFQRALLYRHGKLVEVLEAGRHVRWGKGWALSTVDMRRRIETVNSQEILSQDGLAIKLSASCTYSVSDPRLALEGTESYQAAAHFSVQ